MTYSEYQEISKKIEALYLEMSKESQSFKEKYKISCVVNCGKCCKNPDIYSSPLEMLPLALHLVNSKTDEELLTLLEKLDMTEICAFYENLGGDSGRCTIYNQRSVVCRLFGWTHFKGKKNEEVAICREIKANNQKVLETMIDSKAIAEAPRMGTWDQLVNDLDVNLGSVKYPLNKSLKIMLEKILLVRPSL